MESRVLSIRRERVMPITPHMQECRSEKDRVPRRNCFKGRKLFPGSCARELCAGSLGAKLKLSRYKCSLKSTYDRSTLLTFAFGCQSTVGGIDTLSFTRDWLCSTALSDYLIYRLYRLHATAPPKLQSPFLRNSSACNDEARMNSQEDFGRVTPVLHGVP